MLTQLSFFLFLILSITGKKYNLFNETNSSSTSSNNQRLLIDIDIYNRPYVLPYFLNQLEQLTCPCNECYLDLRLYHVYNNSIENETTKYLNQWVTSMKKSNQKIFTAITIHEWTAKSSNDQANRLSDVIKRVSKLDITYLSNI